MKNKNIIITGAKTHNLKNLSLEIPKNKIVVFTGVSGSGKSSLVFDTIYTEAQRQLIETFSSFARSRMPKLSKPDVEELKNISTAIVIDQKRMGTTLRSTVGTATELYTYLRLLYSRCGNKFIGPSFVFGFNHPSGMCPECKGLGKRIRIDEKRIINWKNSIREGAIDHPDYKVGGWNWREILGIKLFDVDKKLKDFTEKELNDFLYAEGIPIVKEHGASVYSKNYEGVIRKLERLHLNRAQEQLSEDRRDAYLKYFMYSACDACKGTRINEAARSVTVNGKTLPELVNMELNELYEFLKTINNEIAVPIISKMNRILENLIEIGVGYLSINRPVATLSGGESQRVKMARQLDCDLVDMMYILDEPSIGLHPRDNNKLILMLKKLNEKGNSVLVVEHDPDIINCADWIVDIGPKAGVYGGELVYSGKAKGLFQTESITAKYLNKKDNFIFKRKKPEDFFIINNLNLNNLKSISTKIPKGILTCITGVAGAGKSSLINDYFVKKFNDVIMIDQSPVGKSSRSNPATYIGVFDNIRKEIAKKTGTSPSLFSFNSKGACPKCKGLGEISYEMNFLDDVKVICDKCNGKRYTDDVLKIKYNEKNIFDILCMTMNQAKDFFKNKEIKRKLQVLIDVGLGYLEIGQPLNSLSGGEAQRIKLASELHKKGSTYVMDEPTTGLHLADIERLLHIVKKLVENNNSVIIIEHNLEVIKHADWIIDLGPEGGSKGGKILFEGIPEDLIHCEKSYTGKFLRKALLKYE